jgi:hypothetical protein
MRTKSIGIGSRVGCGEGDGAVVGSGNEVSVAVDISVEVGTIGAGDGSLEQLDKSSKSSANMKFKLVNLLVFVFIQVSLYDELPFACTATRVTSSS